MTLADQIRSMRNRGYSSGTIARILKCDRRYVYQIRWRDQQPVVDGLSYKAFCMRKTRADPDYCARERTQHAEYRKRRKAQRLGAEA